MSTFTINSGYTLAEILKDYDPENKLHHIIDVFRDKRPILEEAVWQESNRETSHEYMRLVSKPTGFLTQIDEGYEKEGVNTEPKTEQLAMMGSRFEIDKRLLAIQRDGVAWRAQRAQLHIRGMLENFNRKFWVDSRATDSKAVDGILTRYNALSLANVKDSSTTDTASPAYYPVVILGWGVDRVSMLYPKWGKNTFEEDDRGLVDLLDVNGKPYPGYRSYFNFRYGIMVGDDRFVQRLVNIDANAIKADSTSTFENDLIELVNKLPDPNNCAIYVGRQIMTGIQQRLNSKSNLYFTRENVWDRMMPTFQGIPIIRDDALSTAESAVS